MTIEENDPAPWSQESSGEPSYTGEECTPHDGGSATSHLGDDCRNSDACLLPHSTALMVLHEERLQVGKDPALDIFEALLREKESSHLVLETDYKGTALIQLSVPGLPHVNAPLDVPSLDAWLSRYAHVKLGVLLTTNQLKSIVRTLAGYAIGAPCTTTHAQEVARLLDTDPTFATVYGYAMDMPQPCWTGDPTAGHEELRKYARANNLLRIGKSQFPASPGALKRKLEKVSKVLLDSGVKVTSTRTSRQRFLSIERLTEEVPAP